MKGLKSTTPGPDGHHHIVYVNTDTGVAACSPAVGGGNDGHTHEVIFDPARDPVEPQPAVPPQIDPMTGQPALVQDPQTGQMVPDQGQPATPGDPGKPESTWIVKPAAEGRVAAPQGQNGVVQNGGQPPGEIHDHQLIDYVASAPKSTETDKEVLDDCMSLWREALEATGDSRKKGREAKAFVRGEQWDDGTKRDLNALDRAALTINEIAANIDTLVGYQMETRTDIRYLPTENGDQRIADMLNVVSKKVLDQCYFPREETKVFKDQIEAGLGLFNVGMNFNENIQGEIFVERFPWDDAQYGPHEKEDLADCEYEIRSRMQSIAKLKQIYGKKADEIEASYKSYVGQYPDVNDLGRSGTNMDYVGAKKLDDTQPYTVDGTFPLVDVQKKQFRHVQVTRKIYKEVTVIFNEEEEFFETAYDWKDVDIAAAGLLPGFQTITQVKTRMRITRFCGTVILSDENPADLPLHDFFTVPVYAYRDDGEFWGKVEAAKDPQRELNKRRSQIMDTMNRVGASVIYAEPETFIDKNETERFKKNRSKPGSIFLVNDLNRKPETEPGADVPAALIEIMQMDQENLQRLMNVVIKERGANTSALALSEEKKGRLTGNQFLFDNLSFAKQKLGKLILALLQRYYSPERIKRMLDSQNAKSPFQIGGQDYSQFSEDEILDLLETNDLLEYDVVVSESSFAPTTRMAIAQMLLDLMAKGGQVPPQLPFRFIDMPADLRKEITDDLQAQSQQSVQDAQDTSKAEVIKTLIAKGQYTVSPEKAQELGLVPSSGPQEPSTGSQPLPDNTNIQNTGYADNLASSLAG